MREKGEFMQISHKVELQDLYYGSLLELKREGAMANPHVRAVAVPCHRTRTKSGVLAGQLPEGWKVVSALHNLRHELPDIRGFLVSSVETDAKKWTAWAEQKHTKLKLKKKKAK